MAEQFLGTYGLTAIIALMLLKEIGVPVPIPGDLLMLAAAAQVAEGRYALPLAFGGLLAAMVVGASVQFFFARGVGRRFLYRFGKYIGLTQERLDRAADAVCKGGAVAVALGLSTPGVRIAIVPASGLAELPLATFLTGLIGGSAVFLALHFVIGYIGGPIVGAVMNALNLPTLALIIAFLAVGVTGWMLLRRRAQKNTTVERLADWADASCPVCLAIGAVEHARHAIEQPVQE